MPYTISPAEPGHLSRLNDIEGAAAAIFPPGFLPEHVLQERVPLAALGSAMEQGLLWVALDGRGVPVGYALMELVDGHALLAQMDVHPDHGRQGLGTALIGRVVARVREMGLTALYLTTFTQVPWNAPFYGRLGFRVLEQAEQPHFLQDIRQRERECGLSGRVAMRLEVGNAPDITS